MYKLGAAQGRFHLIHHGHMEYLLECKKRCEFLFIGISDCDPQNAYFHNSYEDSGSNEVYRSLDNPVYPFTYFERAMMITEAMAGEGIDRSEFITVPFPVHFPHLLKYYVPQEAMVFITIYDEWGEGKPDLFRSLGYDTEVLWRRSMDERFTTATFAREQLSSGEDLSGLVPDGTAVVIKKFSLDDRMAEKRK